MKKSTIFGAMASVLALAACGEPAGNTTAGNEAATNAAAPAAEANEAKPAEANASASAAPAAAGGPPNRDYLVGRWTESTDCAADGLDLRADGTLSLPWGDTGQWTLEGDRLAMVGIPEPIRLEVVSQTEMRATKATGAVNTWTRC